MKPILCKVVHFITRFLPVCFFISIRFLLATSLFLFTSSVDCPRFICYPLPSASRDSPERRVQLHCNLSNQVPSRQEGPTDSSSRRGAVGSPAPPPGWRAVAGAGPRFGDRPAASASASAAGNEPSSVAFINGYCVTEYYLSKLRPNASSAAVTATVSDADGQTKGEGKVVDEESSQMRMVLDRLIGFDDISQDGYYPWSMVCNTTSTSSPSSFRSSSSSAWQRCAQRVPRLEIVENLTPKRSAVCVVCTSISHTGGSELVYHSISQSLRLRLVLGSTSSSSSSHTSSYYASSVPSLSVILSLYSPRPYSSSSSFNTGPKSSGERSQARMPSSKGEYGRRG